MNGIEIEYIRMAQKVVFYKGKVKALQMAQSSQPRNYASATGDKDKQSEEGEVVLSEASPSRKNCNTVLIRPLDNESLKTSPQTKDKLLKGIKMGTYMRCQSYNKL